MRVDASLAGRLEEVPRVVDGIRRLGYDGLFTSEVAHDPFLPLARAAEASGDMELGTSIAVAFARSPMTLAGTAWDLQALTGGRMVLGLGSQVRSHIERRFSMPWSRPAARMGEFIVALRAIWTSWQDGVPLDFRGDFYTHTLMTPTFDPGPICSGPPRVLAAAVGQAMTRKVAEVADGLLVHSFTTRRYLEEVILPEVDAALEARRCAPNHFQIKYTPFIVTGADDEALDRASTAVRERIAFYGSTPAYRPVLELHGWGALQSDLAALARQGQWETMGDLIDDEVLAAFAIVTPIDGLSAAYRRWVEGLVDRTTFTVPPGVEPDHAAAIVGELRALGGRSKQ